MADGNYVPFPTMTEKAPYRTEKAQAIQQDKQQDGRAGTGHGQARTAYAGGRRFADAMTDAFAGPGPELRRPWTVTVMCEMPAEVLAMSGDDAERIALQRLLEHEQALTGLGLRVAQVFAEPAGGDPGED